MAGLVHGEELMAFRNITPSRARASMTGETRGSAPPHAPSRSARKVSIMYSTTLGGDSSAAPETMRGSPKNPTPP